MAAAGKPAEKSAPKARVLVANVYVGGDLYEAGSTPSADVAKQITNPKAWGDQPDAED